MSDNSLREAAQMALEMLDISRNAFEAWGNSTVKIDQAFDALSAALAAPDAPVQPASNLFEFWWAEYMPEATQDQAWRAWQAAPLAQGVVAAQPAQVEPAKPLDLITVDELAKVHSSSYTSPHHMRFCVDGLRDLINAAHGIQGAKS